MKKYLLPETGNFYKANLHCHTTLSDGRRTPEEVKALYRSKGYSIVAYTDHDILIPHDDLADENFLPLHGFEAEINEHIPDAPFEEIKTCHICFIGIDPDNIIQPCWHRNNYQFGNAVNNKHLVKFDENEPDFVRAYTPERISEMMQKAREKGFFVTYNHPAWSKEFYPDYIGYKGMHAFEMFNGGCLRSGYDDYNPKVYDDFLQAGNMIYCTGSDDNHNVSPDASRWSDSGWAFTVIKAERLDYRAVTDALVKGHFYASEGPEIQELWVDDDNVVHLKCSPADHVFVTFDIRSCAPAWAEHGNLITEHSFGLPQNAKYFRITVVDEHGKHACTNAYPVADLLQ